MQGHKERISLEDSFMTISMKLSEGNPGALNVIMQIIKDNGKIDPDAVLGPLFILMSLDSFGIYGSNIWMLYKDVCGENLVNFVAILRAVQLGIMSIHMLRRAIGSSTIEVVKIDVPELLANVRVQLPEFGKTGTEEG